jgi:hypothetical protein
MSARFLPGFIALAWSVAATADVIDGTAPLECEARKGHDCMPDKAGCSPLKSESKTQPVLRIDFAKREVRSPFRTELLNVTHSTATKESLILQGGEERGFAWSAVIKKKDGAFTVSIADREGAYVVFGTCKIAKTS